MELKNYQSTVLHDLSVYLDKVQETKNISDAFMEFWENHERTPLTPTLGNAIEPYFNSVKNAPHICIKVPTAGGKTFIASSSLKIIFDHFGKEKAKAVVWLVPSEAILTQTLKNLKDTSHPYRQKIDVDFSGKVEVYNKKELLNASNLSVESVMQNLSIFVMSFDSFRTNNKDGRKVYAGNGNLQKFSSMIQNSEDEEISVMKVLQKLNPVVIVDESHNARSELSIKMLNDLNPSLVLDLTATPREESNIISIVPAIELKKANMIKLPVIVSNQSDKMGVINNALHLQKHLELQAKFAFKSKTDSYIRPIVLFQAQPKKGDENTTFEKIKEILLKKGIPEEQIKIKTSEKNELDRIDLLSPKCKVRYIITVNALKEGWDCPFAYILASLADRNSSVDVEQILGRVLRLPNTRKHSVSELNFSYVLTSSSNFLGTLNQIVKGLNAAGFTEDDYKVQTSNENISNGEIKQFELFDDFEKVKEEINSNDDFSPIIDNEKEFSYEIPPSNFSIAEPSNPFVNSMVNEAKIQEKDFEKKMQESENQNTNSYVPQEMKSQVMQSKINEIYKESALNTKLYQFSTHEILGDLFGEETEIKFDRNELLKNFKLGNADTEINFESKKSELYKIDLDESKKDCIPTFSKIDGTSKDYLLKIINDKKSKESKIAILTNSLMQTIGNMFPIADSEVQKYIKRVMENFNDEQLSDLVENEYSYAELIKEKIKSLAKSYVYKNFKDEILKNHIETKCSWEFPLSKNLSQKVMSLPKSLYDKEEVVNSFELEVINEIANMKNIEWWTRNREKKDFYINGFINHYPDFIIKTNKGNVILLETKGDHLDAEEKIELGNLWQNSMGKNYKYCLVYNERVVQGSFTKNDFLDLVKDL